jgi:hypothetical protein
VRAHISDVINGNPLGTPSVRTMMASGGIFEYDWGYEAALSILFKCSLNTTCNTAPIGVAPAVKSQDLGNEHD